MKKNSVPLFAILLLVIVVKGFSQEYQVRIGFLGNSITMGHGLPNPAEDCYPGQLADMVTEIFGDTVIIKNFAVSGRTMLKKVIFRFGMKNCFLKAGSLLLIYALFFQAQTILNHKIGISMAMSFLMIIWPCLILLN